MGLVPSGVASMAPTILQICRIFLASILAVLNTIMLKKKLPMSKQPKKSAAPVMKESNKAMEVDTVIIRNMVVVMHTALLVDTDILMEAMVTEVCVNTAEVTENMEDTEITDTNRIMVEVMAMDIPLMEAMVMEEDTNRMAKDTEGDMEVTETTNLEAMVVTAVSNLEAMAVTVATNTEVMVVTDLEAMVVTVDSSLEVMAATEVVMATLIPIIPQTKMNTSQKLEILISY